jgi:hypothetical protein
MAMLAKTLTIPEDAMVNMLKTLPDDILVEVFWKALVESDVSPLTHEEREEIDKGRIEFKKGETIKWDTLK